MSPTTSHRIYPLTRLRATTSECTSLRYGSVHVGGHMIGRSVRTLILVRRLGGGTHVSTITLVRRVLSFAVVVVVRATLVSSHTACSSAGYTPLDTAHSPARTDHTASAASASSHTPPTSSASSPSLPRVDSVATRSSAIRLRVGSGTTRCCACSPSRRRVDSDVSFPSRRRVDSGLTRWVFRRRRCLTRFLSRRRCRRVTGVGR